LAWTANAAGDQQTAAFHHTAPGTCKRQEWEFTMPKGISPKTQHQPHRSWLELFAPGAHSHNHPVTCATLLHAQHRCHQEPRRAHIPPSATNATRLHAQSRSRHEPRGALDPVPRRSASRQDWSIQRASTSGTRRADHQAEVARSPNSTIHPNPANAHMPEQCLHDLRSQPSRASETTPWTRPAGLEPGQHYAQTQQRAQQQASKSRTQPTEPSDENDTTRARDDPSPAPQRHGPPRGAPSSDPHDPWVCALVPLRLTPSSAK